MELSVHAGITEWFAPAEWGIEFGWTVQAAVPGEGALVLELDVGAAEVEVDGDRRSAWLVDADQGVWTVTGLRAWDAHGVELPTGFETSGASLDVRVDARGAIYPWLKSPGGYVAVYLGASKGPAPTASWGVSSTITSAGFGHAVASAGDVNGDGYDDVIIGAPYDTNVQSKEGGAFVYLGSSAGTAQRLCTRRGTTRARPS